MASPGELRRQLGLSSAVAVIVGEVIGAGIFLTPAPMAKALGSPLWLLVVWLTIGAVTLAGALSLSELVARYPAAGGMYVYLREAFGPGTAFLFGWMSLLVLDPGITALLATILASYAGGVLGLSDFGRSAVAVGVVLTLAVVNIVGVRLGARLLRGLTVLKVGLLLLIVCWGFGSGLGNANHFTPFIAQHPGSDPLAKALVGGLMAAFFAFGGWWDVSKMAGEVRDPERTVPRALLLGVLTVTALYILISAVFLYLVPLSRITSEQAFAVEVGGVLFGWTGTIVFGSIVIVIVFGTLASLMMVSPRVYFAMAQDGLFLPAVAALHPRFGTPARAIALQAVLACLLLVSGKFEQILAYFFFTAVAFVGLTIASIFVLRQRSPAPAAYRTPGYPFTPLFFLIVMVILLIFLAISRPLETFLGVGVVVLGVPVYLLAFRRRKPSEDSSLPAKAERPATAPDAQGI